jgi:uncharacterized protein (TIGR02246 family)
MSHFASRRIRFAPLYLCVGFAALTACSTSLTATAPEEHLVGEFINHFLRAFEDLDMPSFIECFADDATVFFPVPEPPLRFEGKPEIRAHFELVFAAIRRGADGPPYHRLPAEDLAVQLVGSEAAIVSFHLRNAERTARRTLVLKKARGGWLIAHLHASNVPTSR